MNITLFTASFIRKAIRRKLTALYLLTIVLSLATKTFASEAISPFQIHGKPSQNIGIGFVRPHDKAALHLAPNGKILGAVRAQVEPDWGNALNIHPNAYRITATDNNWVRLSGGGWLDMEKKTAGSVPSIVLWKELGLGYIALPTSLDMPNLEKPAAIAVFDRPNGDILKNVAARDRAIYSHTPGKYEDHRIVFNTAIIQNTHWFEIKPGNWIRHEGFISWKDFYQENELNDHPSPDIISIYEQPLLLHYPGESSGEAKHHNIAKAGDGEKTITTRNKRITVLTTRGKFAFVLIQASTEPSSYCSNNALHGYLGWIRFLDDNDKALLYGGAGLSC